MTIVARLHLFPWSMVTREETIDLTEQPTEFSFFGSPVLSLVEGSKVILPSRHERFEPLGPKFPLQTSVLRLYEIPQNNNSADNCELNFSIHSTEHGKECIRLFSNGQKERTLGSDETGNLKDSSLAQVVLNWSSYFDKLLEMALEKGGSNEFLEWKVVKEYLSELKDEKQEPFRGIIVDISEKMHSFIPEVVRSARRILNRERRLQLASRIEEMDSACLSWLGRQPGNTVLEKAGSRQQLLGISRKETRDLHENRILKDFLRRCCLEGRRYVRNAREENPDFRGTRRVKRVESFANQCDQLFSHTHLINVSEPHPGMPPNFVLLNDMRYRKVWYWYQRLLRREREKDRFWDWQARTWADVVRQLISVAILNQENLGDDSFRLSALYEGSLHIRSEQALGCRTFPGSEAGPYRIDWAKEHNPIPAVLEIVHPDFAEKHPVTKGLGFTGGHLYLVVQPIGKVGRPQVIIIWAVHTASSTNVHLQERTNREDSCKTDKWKMIESASKALEGHQATLNLQRDTLSKFTLSLSGLILCSSIEATSANYESEKNIGLVVVPTNPRGWQDAMVTISLALNYILEKKPNA